MIETKTKTPSSSPKIMLKLHLKLTKFPVNLLVKCGNLLKFNTKIFINMMTLML